MASNFLAIIFFGLLVAAPIWLLRTILHMVRAPVGRRAAACGKCGYELAMVPGGLTLCSECGEDLLDAGIVPPREQSREAGRLEVGISLAIPFGLLAILLGFVILGYWPYQSSSMTYSASYVPAGVFTSKQVIEVAGAFDVIAERSPHRGTLQLKMTGPREASASLEIDIPSRKVVASSNAEAIRAGSDFSVATLRVLYGLAGIDISESPGWTTEIDELNAELAGLLSNPRKLAGKIPFQSPQSRLRANKHGLSSQSQGAVLPIGSHAVALLPIYVCFAACCYVVLVMVALKARKRAHAAAASRAAGC